MPGNNVPPPTPVPALPSLTRREREVLDELTRPLGGDTPFTEPASVKEIAGRLFVTQAAVKQHLLRLYDKFEIWEGEPRRRLKLANEAMRRRPHDHVHPLEAAREAFDRRDWATAAQLFATADSRDQLGPEDLERWGEAGIWSDRHEESAAARECAHAAYLERQDERGAGRVAIGLAYNAIVRCQFSLVAGWMNTARRLLGDLEESAEHADLAAISAILQIAEGETEAGLDSARAAHEIGGRTGNADAQAMGLVNQGHALARQGRIREGFDLLDEAMAFASSRQLGPMATGVVYCRTISACLDLWDFRRALEWTDEVDRREQGGEAGFPGDCMTHRAALRIVHGEWAEAEREAEFACVTGDLFDRNHVGAAIYEIGEIKLRTGDLDAAENAFRRANEMANPCQPGMALLMLARGDPEAASASIGAAVASVPNDALVRAHLLPAQVTIALAAGDVDAAAVAATDLDGIGERFGTAALRAAAASARGSVDVERGRSAQAVTELRSGVQLWTEVGAPYESALARVGLGQALVALEDRGGAAMELRAASAAFERLGAEPDLIRTNERLRQID